MNTATPLTDAVIEANADIEALQIALAGLARRLEAELAVAQAKYMELIYEVGSKHEGESRHDTARRYIRERENRIEGPSSSANVTSSYG